VLPKIFGVLALAGCVARDPVGASRAPPLVAALAIGAPIALALAVVCTSGVGGWSFQNYRYIATAFPLVAMLAALGLTPPPRCAAMRAMRGSAQPASSRSCSSSRRGRRCAITCCCSRRAPPTPTRRS